MEVNFDALGAAGGYDHQGVLGNAEIDQKLQQCFSQFLQSLSVNMEAPILELRQCRTPSEVAPTIQIYQDLTAWAKNAAFEGYVQFAQQAEIVRNKIMADQFAVGNSALEVQRELLRHEAQLQVLLIQRNNRILQAQAQAMKHCDQRHNRVVVIKVIAAGSDGVIHHRREHRHHHRSFISIKAADHSINNHYTFGEINYVAIK